MSKQYAQIDLHDDDGSLWPKVMPVLTGPEAIRAARRLWRFSLGNEPIPKIELTSGNRYTWVHLGVFKINPDKGWKRLVHDLSHYFVNRCNPDERPHSKFHARFERKLVKEVIKRGWLDGRLKTGMEVLPKLEPDPKLAKLKQITAGIERWEKKASRAKKALAKLVKKRKYYERAISA